MNWQLWPQNDSFFCRSSCYYCSFLSRWKPTLLPCCSCTCWAGAFLTLWTATCGLLLYLLFSVFFIVVVSVSIFIYIYNVLSQWSHCLQSDLTTCTVILLPAQWSHCLHSGPTVCTVVSGYSASAQTRLRPQPPRHSALCAFIGDLLYYLITFVWSSFVRIVW